MAISIQETIKSASRYAATHPKVLGQIARYALRRRVAIPLDSIRWLVTQMPAGDKAPSEVTITARSPALGVGATLDVMGTGLRVDTAIHVDHIHATEQDLEVTIRVKDLRASVLNNLDGNLAKLLKSGVLNLSKPASLLGMIGKKPKLIKEAKDDLFVLDLMQLKGVSRNPMVQRVLRTLTPVLAVADVRTEGDLLVIGLKAKPKGFRRSLANIRS